MVLCLGTLLAQFGRHPVWVSDQLAQNIVQLQLVSDVMLGLQDEIFQKITAEVTFGVYSVRHEYPTDDFKMRSKSCNQFLSKTEEAESSPVAQRSLDQPSTCPQEAKAARCCFRSS